MASDVFPNDVVVGNVSSRKFNTLVWSQRPRELLPVD